MLFFLSKAFVETDLISIICLFIYSICFARPRRLASQGAGISILQPRLRKKKKAPVIMAAVAISGCHA